MYEEQWCLDLYNSTNCTEIRDEAQKETNSILLIFYRFLASWGCVYMFFMLLIIKALERIISKPMVQKSREVNVVGWLTFPVFCTALFGSIILFAPYTTLYEVVETRYALARIFHYQSQSIHANSHFRRIFFFEFFSDGSDTCI